MAHYDPHKEPRRKQSEHPPVAATSADSGNAPWSKQRDGLVCAADEAFHRLPLSLVLVLALSVAGLLPLLTDLFTGGPILPWVTMLCCCLVVGSGLVFAGRNARREDLRIREGIVITSTIWFLFSALAAIPLVMATPANYVLAWFETTSGLTATGATIFGDADFYTLADLQRWHPPLARPAAMDGRHWHRQHWGLAILPLLTGSSGFQPVP